MLKECVCLCVCVCGPSLPGWQGQGVWWQGIWGSDTTGKSSDLLQQFVLHRRVSANVLLTIPGWLGSAISQPDVQRPKTSKEPAMKKSYLQNTRGGSVSLRLHQTAPLPFQGQFAGRECAKQRPELPFHTFLNTWTSRKSVCVCGCLCV